MATYYVDSAAVGANNGSSWADAWLSIHSALTTAIGGDIVLVEHRHSEDLFASRSYTMLGVSPIRVLSVDKIDDSMSLGALIQTVLANRNIYFYGPWYMYGMRWEAGGQIGFSPGPEVKVVAEQCYFKIGTFSATAIFFPTFSLDDNAIKFIETDIELVGASSVIYVYSRFEWIGGTLITSSSIGWLFVYKDGTSIKVSGVDLSAESNAIFSPGGNTIYKGEMLIERCKLHASVLVVSGPVVGPSGRFKAHHCQAGTDGDPAYAMEEHAYYGTIKVNVAAYRHGGASDKERSFPYSWALSTNVNAEEIYLPLESPPIVGWTNGDGSTTYTYTIYVATSTNPLQDDEFWVELSLPNDADTSSQAGRESTRLDPYGTPSNIAGDFVSTWAGIGAAVRHKIEISYTPQKPGLVIARCFLAKPSKIVFADPKIYISRGGKPDMAAQGRAIVVPGYGAVQEGEARMLVGPGMGGGLR